MKKTLFYLFLFASFVTYSQTDYFVNVADTVYAKNINYKLTSQSYLARINYTDLDGNERVIEGKKELAGVSTFLVNGQIIDKIPQKAHKPDKYVKWATRVVHGKLIVNYYYNEITTFSKNTYKSEKMTERTSGIAKFFIKMPDGTFYDIINNRDRKKYIIPYLQECEAFNAAYKGKFEKNYVSFIEMINLYNSLCE